MNLHDHHLIRLLTNLRLPVGDYVIFGSGPLLAHGLRTTISDLDIVARDTAWHICASLSAPYPAPSGHGHMIRLYGGALEIVDRWLSPMWDTDRLVDSAQLIDGLPFASLTDVIASKWATDRPKDHTDLHAIRAHTAHAYALTGGTR
ncbi:hypothetical protein [Jidongwangia harbinensis]|uniref:hypothetical protein n=1 Tax=Jidongwangia harbinensis TaxID=2878561 RepID=UPI001CDA241C|nr:hypothetical protein [Jidongwangia harbinensis]MCA2219517.1 hypothetical protein [Jidongwangia harbinensis]